MRNFASRMKLALVAGASLALASGSAALAQEPMPAEVEFEAFEAAPGADMGTAQQIVPLECFDPATGEFSAALSSACGAFAGAPGTEGGVGPTGALTTGEMIAAMPRAPAAPSIAAAPAPGTWEEPAVAADSEAQLAAPSPQPEAVAPAGDELPPPSPDLFD